MKIDARLRLFLGSAEEQMGHRQPMAGTPVDVPDPKIVIRITVYGPRGDDETAADHRVFNKPEADQPPYRNPSRQIGGTGKRSGTAR